MRGAFKHGYPLWLLRLSIASYMIGRTVRVAGVYSVIVYAARGITAGAGLATTEMRLILITFCDYTVSSVPGSILTVFVDDVGVEHTSTAANVVKRQIKALNIINQGLVRLRMALSDSKGVVTASTPSIGAAIAAGAARLGVIVKHSATARSLGHGLGAGVRRCSHVLRKRLVAFRARRPLFWALRRAGVHGTKLVRTGGAAAMQYGQAPMGVAPSMLHAQRVATVAVVAAGARGRDLDLTLITADTQSAHRTDPAFAAHIEPIAKWAQAVWYSWLPAQLMSSMIARARVRLAAAKRVWQAVTGPAAAVVATAGRIGWTVHSATSITTDEGRQLNLDLDPPMYYRWTCSGRRAQVAMGARGCQVPCFVGRRGSAKAHGGGCTYPQAACAGPSRGELDGPPSRRVGVRCLRRPVDPSAPARRPPCRAPVLHAVLYCRRWGPGCWGHGRLGPCSPRHNQAPASVPALEHGQGRCGTSHARPTHAH